MKFHGLWKVKENDVIDFSETKMQEARIFSLFVSFIGVFHIILKTLSN